MVIFLWNLGNESSSGVQVICLVSEWLFNTVGVGLLGKFGWRVRKKLHPLPIELIFYIYPNSIVFHENNLFITFIKKHYQ